MWETVHQKLQALLDLRVAEESHNEWQSTIMLVPKPDGSNQFCINLWRVNAISKFDEYPTPTVDDLLYRLRAGRYISPLNIMMG